MRMLVPGLLGLFIGAIAWRDAGWLFGGLVGLLIGQWFLLRERLSRLENELSALRSTGEKKAPSPPMAPPQGPAPSREPEFSFEMISEPPIAKRPAATEPIRTYPLEDFPTRPAPSEETPPQPLWEQLPEWVRGGNLLVKVGVVILFFGVSFLLKYAAQYGFVPIELRLSAVALGGLALLAIGWRLRGKRERYALALQGGGVGILYLTIFAAFRLYQLIPASAAFALLTAICLFSAILAVLENAPALAVLGFSGGFLAPVLASTGSGSHVALFSYYGLLNAGIIGIAWFRSWRLLTLVGFFFTFVIATAWGGRYYRPEHLSTTEPFLLLYLFLFVVASILSSRRQPLQLKGYVDGTLVFGTPIVAFALQARLFAGSEFGLAWSAVGFGLFYLLCAWFCFARLERSGRLLAESFLAFGIIFATLAIPLAFDGRWTSAAWALEGGAILWAGLRQQRRLPRFFGMLLVVAAGIFFLLEMGRPTGNLPLLNGIYLGTLLISGGALFSAWQLHRHRERISPWEHGAMVGLFILGLLWWVAGGLHEIDRHLPWGHQAGAVLLFFAASAAALSSLRWRLAWPLCRWPALALLPLCWLLLLGLSLGYGHPFTMGGGYGWPLALLLLYRIFHQQDETLHGGWEPLHAAALWLVTAVITVEVSWQVHELVAGSGVWSLISWGAIPALIMMLLALWGDRPAWPLPPHRDCYLTLGLSPIACGAWLWAAYATLTSSGSPWPLPYLPLLNPLDIAIAFVAVGWWGWSLALSRHKIDLWGDRSGPQVFFFALSLFFWGNGLLARIVHHWGRVPFAPGSLWRSTLLQTTLTIAWSLLALALMVLATRRSLRTWWLAGALLLALVVAKLFFVDLSGVGTIERIISFVGVGVLTLLIGWFAPAPPQTKGSPS